MLRVIIVTTLTFLFNLACSTTSEEETPKEELAESEENADASIEENSSTETASSETNEMPADPGIADLDNVAKEMKPSEFLSSALGSNPPPAEPQAPAIASVSSQNRVVRFIAVDGARAFDGPNDQAQVVGQYTQGDAVVVMIQEGWASISSNRFIKLSDLSEDIVKRPKNNPWKK